MILASASARASAAREREQSVVDGLDLPARESEQRVRRAAFGAEREELLASLDDLGAWYRDVVLVSAGAEGAVANADRLDDLRADAAAGMGTAAEDAAAVVRQAWREAEEFNLNATLLLEALFVRLRRVFAATGAASVGR